MIHLDVVADDFACFLAINANAGNDVLSTLTVLDFVELDWAINCYILPAVSHLLLNIPQTLFDFLLVLLHPGYGALGGLQLRTQFLYLVIFCKLIGVVLLFQMGKLGLAFVVRRLEFT